MSNKKNDDTLMYGVLALIGFFVLKPVLFPAKKTTATVVPGGSGSGGYNAAYVTQPQQSSLTTGITNFLNAFKKSDVYDSITNNSTDADVVSRDYIDQGGASYSYGTNCYEKFPAVDTPIEWY